MNTTLLNRLLLSGSIGLFAAGCVGEDPAPKRVLTQEAVQPGNANAADEYGTGATLFGGPIGERLVPRHKTIEETTVDTLARIGTPSVPALVAVLRDPDVELRKSAARALAKMGSEATPAVPDLIAALSDQDLEVRKFATRALGEIGPPAGDAIPALIEELRESAKQAELEAQAAKAHQPAKQGIPNPLAPPKQ